MIEINKATKEYQLGGSTYRALNDVTLTIEDGEFVSILGPSGSGKSTLMHVMGGLDRPTVGSVEIRGIDLATMNDRSLAHFRNRTIGFVFQSFYLLPQISALENVLLPLVYGEERKSRRQKATEALKKVGLSERLKNRPNQLSGGEQQRVAIARALVNDPDIILADEPTGNLDSKTSREIVSILEDLHKKGRTVIVVTHAEEVADVAGRTIRMLDGKVVKGRRK